VNDVVEGGGGEGRRTTDGDSNTHSYAFTIVTHDMVRIHLAARSSELRQQWMDQIRYVSQSRSSSTSLPSSNNGITTGSHGPTNQNRPIRHSVHTTMTTPYMTRESQQSSSSRLLLPPATVPTNFQRRALSNGGVQLPPSPSLPPPMEIESMQPRRLQLLTDTPTTTNTNDNNNNNSTDTAAVFLHRYIRPPSHRNVTLQNVSVSLRQKIDDKISYYLPMCSDDVTIPNNNNNNNIKNQWKKVSIPSSSTSQVLHHTAYQRMDNTSNHTKAVLMIHRTTAILPHSPVHVFRLIMDITQRHKYESNVDTNNNERMNIINDYTFLDYYSYKPVRIL
jgi:hypothetical protein